MPTKQKAIRIPKRAQRVIDALRKGQTLCRGYRPRAIGEADQVVVWWYEPDGATVGPGSVAQAMATGLLEPCDQGLLGDGNAQSYTVRA